MADLLTIKPDTKIADLLKSYPELEEPLVQLAPAFRKLKNPVLRKTVARITDLSQAARIGNIPLGKLINELRAAVGQEEYLVNDSAESLEGSDNHQWVKTGTVKKSLDAGPLLECGKHPVDIVMKELSDLNDREIFLLVTPFLPSPLIDLAQKKGYLTHTEKEADEVFKTYFTIFR